MENTHTSDFIQVVTQLKDVSTLMKIINKLPS